MGALEAAFEARTAREGQPVSRAHAAALGVHDARVHGARRAFGLACVLELGLERHLAVARVEQVELGPGRREALARQSGVGVLGRGARERDGVFGEALDRRMREIAGRDQRSRQAVRTAHEGAQAERTLARLLHVVDLVTAHARLEGIRGEPESVGGVCAGLAGGLDGVAHEVEPINARCLPP
jgi:hypothetical protein